MNHTDRCHRFHALAYLLAAGVFPAAQEPPPEAGTALDPLQELLDLRVVVSSTKAGTLLNSPSTVSIIDREAIHRYNFQTISEILDMVVGTDVMRTHQKRDVVTIRGVLQDNYTAKILILINGVPSWFAVTGEGTPYRVDPSDVERIEVLRGPASVLYGSNAYVGVVNIVLRSPVSHEAEAHGGLASRGGAWPAHVSNSAGERTGT